MSSSSGLVGRLLVALFAASSFACTVAEGGVDAGPVDAFTGDSGPSPVAVDAGAPEDAATTDGDAGRSPVPCEIDDVQTLVVGDHQANFTPLDGGDLPCWSRPQGGIGSRVSATVDGVPEDAELGLMRIQFFGRTSTTPCQAREDCGQFEWCPPDGSFCQTYIANQTLASYDALCLVDGTVGVLEIPVLFRVDMHLAQLEDLPVEVRVSFEQPDAGPVVTGSARAVLRYGPFNQPSWWNEP